MTGPGPFPLKPIFLPKVWAAPRFTGPLAADLAPPPGIGEIWLASGREHITQVADGPLAGLGLDQAVEKHRDWLLGDGPWPCFPLILKLLSVGDWLSVQVHPDDDTARRLENEPWGKSEAWLITRAEPGAEIILGLKQGAGRTELERALAAGELPPILARVPARMGDVFHLPAGQIHATGPGIELFEIQQASDITYRFYDWDRPGTDGKPRELHQAKALAAMHISGPGAPVAPGALAGPKGVSRVRLISDRHFSLLRCELEADYRLENQAAPRLLLALAGGGRIECPACGEAPGRISPGPAWLIPARAGDVRILPEPGGLVLLEAAAEIV